MNRSMNCGLGRKLQDSLTVVLLQHPCGVMPPDLLPETGATNQSERDL